MDLIQEIERRIDARSLLTHPFYTKWQAGTLARHALQDYARQYYAFESSFPRFLSALHARTDRADIRQALLENLWDEEHGPNNHAELWLRFAEGVGVDRADVHEATLHPGSQALVDTYERITSEAPVAAGVAAVYAYERQVPAVATAKMEGLRTHFGVDDDRSLSFFELHATLDVEHSEAERHIVADQGDGVEDQVLSATDAALDAWWTFLDDVDVVAAPA
jgi:pyrroloquinoline-quinone synthase